MFPHHWFGDWHGGGWMVLWWLFGLGLLAFVILYGARGSRREPLRTPEDVLRARFAQGQIDQTTYHQMLEDLRR